MPPLIDPRLMRHIAPNRFASRGDVQRKTATQDGFGDVVITYVPDAQLKQISCQVEPRMNRTDNEVRRPDQTVVTEPFDVLLDGYYPTILVEDQFKVWPTLQLHNILRVAHDDQRAYTRLTTEIVSG